MHGVFYNSWNYKKKQITDNHRGKRGEEGGWFYFQIGIAIDFIQIQTFVLKSLQ